MPGSTWRIKSTCETTQTVQSAAPYATVTVTVSVSVSVTVSRLGMPLHVASHASMSARLRGTRAALQGFPGHTPAPLCAESVSARALARLRRMWRPWRASRDRATLTSPRAAAPSGSASPPPATAKLARARAMRLSARRACRATRSPSVARFCGDGRRCVATWGGHARYPCTTDAVGCHRRR